MLFGMPQPTPHPLDIFGTPAIAFALGTGAFAIACLGVWFWVSEDAPLAGAAMIAIAAFDVVLLVAARVRKRRAAQAREEAGIIEPMENRPPT